MSTLTTKHETNYIIRKKRLFLALLGITISLVSLGFAFRDIDTKQLVATLCRSELLFSIPLLMAYGMFYWLKAIRWCLLLQPIKHTTTREIFSPMMMGFFANNILPAHLGEFVRMYLGAKILKLSNSQVLATIVLERILDILIIILLLGMVLITEGRLPAFFVNLGYLATIAGIISLILIFFYVRWNLLFLGAISKCLKNFPKNISDIIIRQFELATTGIYSVKSSSLLARIVATSLLQWFFMGGCIYFSLLAVGIILPFSASLLVLSCMVFAVIIPSAPGFFGIIQIAFLLSLRPFDIDDGTAIAASIYFHIFTFMSVTLLGFYLMHAMGFKFRELKKASNAAETEAH